MNILLLSVCAYVFSGIDPDGLLSWYSWVMIRTRKWELEGLEVERVLVVLADLEDLADLEVLMTYVSDTLQFVVYPICFVCPTWYLIFNELLHGLVSILWIMPGNAVRQLSLCEA